MRYDNKNFHPEEIIIDRGEAHFLLPKYLNTFVLLNFIKIIL